MSRLPERVKSKMKAEGLTAVNKPKRTPNHPTKSHCVMASEGGKYKFIRFGQQGVKGAGKNPTTAKDKARKKSYYARHNAQGKPTTKLSAKYWSHKVKWQDYKMRPSEREKILAKARKVRERKQSTYDEVPSGRLTSRVQKAKDALDGRKGAKATSGTVLTFKDTGSGKGPDPKGLFKPRPKTQANRAKSQGGRSAAEVAANRKKTPSTKSRDKDGLGTKAKSAAKKYNVGVSKGGVSFKEAFKYFRGLGNKTFTWNGNKYTTDVAKAKPKARISTPTPADFTATGTKPAPKKTASKDPRKGFASKATPGKAKAALPAGALRTFTGSRGYNNKKEVLRKINGKTYVFKKGK